MPKLLSQAQIERFREEGFLAPIRVMPETDAIEYRRRLERFEATTGGPMAGDLRHKPHLLFTWLADLVRHPRILDAVEDLYRPRPAVLVVELLHQGRGEPLLRVVAPGLDLLGSEPAGRGHRLGRVHAGRRGERRDAGDARAAITSTRSRTATPSRNTTC